MTRIKRNPFLGLLMTLVVLFLGGTAFAYPPTPCNWDTGNRYRYSRPVREGEPAEFGGICQGYDGNIGISASISHFGAVPTGTDIVMVKCPPALQVCIWEERNGWNRDDHARGMYYRPNTTWPDDLYFCGGDADQPGAVNGRNIVKNHRSNTSRGFWQVWVPGDQFAARGYTCTVMNSTTYPELHFWQAGRTGSAGSSDYFLSLHRDGSLDPAWYTEPSDEDDQATDVAYDAIHDVVFAVGTRWDPAPVNAYKFWIRAFDRQLTQVLAYQEFWDVHTSKDRDREPRILLSPDCASIYVFGTGTEDPQVPERLFALRYVWDGAAHTFALTHSQLYVDLGTGFEFLDARYHDGTPSFTELPTIWATGWVEDNRVFLAKLNAGDLTASYYDASPFVDKIGEVRPANGLSLSFTGKRPNEPDFTYHVLVAGWVDNGNQQGKEVLLLDYTGLGYPQRFGYGIYGGVFVSPDPDDIHNVGVLTGWGGSTIYVGGVLKDNLSAWYTAYIVSFVLPPGNIVNPGVQGTPGSLGPAAPAISCVPTVAARGTTVRWSVCARANVSLEIVDMSGRVVSVLRQGSAMPGSYSTSWDGTASGQRVLPAGVYFCRLTANDQSAQVPVTLLR